MYQCRNKVNTNINKCVQKFTAIYVIYNIDEMRSWCHVCIFAFRNCSLSLTSKCQCKGVFVSLVFPHGCFVDPMRLPVQSTKASTLYICVYFSSFFFYFLSTCIFHFHHCFLILFIKMFYSIALQNITKRYFFFFYYTYQLRKYCVISHGIPLL